MTDQERVIRLATKFDVYRENVRVNGGYQPQIVMVDMDLDDAGAIRHLLARSDIAAELLNFVQKIATIGMCEDEDEKANCYLGSGPYCGVHGDLVIDDEIKEARALVAKVEGRER